MNTQLLTDSFWKVIFETTPGIIDGCQLIKIARKLYNNVHYVSNTGPDGRVFTLKMVHSQGKRDQDGRSLLIWMVLSASELGQTEISPRQFRSADDVMRDVYGIEPALSVV